MIIRSKKGKIDEKEKIVKWLFLALFVIILGFLAYLFYQKTVIVGQLEEREQLLTAVSMEL
ncbi:MULTISPECIES: hypothetical protein [Aneurinibacillus]|uniref:Uncharacterized protein n=1 Tax=Aneurinibacillus thermoaerophilus TaxID=143495 RepID=A0ABX8YC43_ANETH|nr:MULTISPECIES: hypothetical protein [Aneurinibacillus]AMA74181.1 hypothetical protein ACH33_16050 [Aneurinibacillus sp. XH2]MED0677332.1 hypothetical protein [Aneurinibacillus thermoaerophilus]MED0679089.1 hypothetical protein [Aneurinibacillus thermoaerophilus]MED0736604.1 hypothetical protein [Aneurinibacillus thermoaerophilus]MED0765334.1 hypothetical protein [Aneurinibacillus thermoaerophilus]